uniref:NADP-dependent oxidoreductase domain-containing protein n=1 Tax=Chlamydomonas leiostraca TaxID=1034604 RepID=A0A7S0RL12_9CHLO
MEYRVRSSLARLGAPRADLVLLHWDDLAARGPRGAGYTDAALWLADLQGKGLARGVGLTNFDSPSLLRVLDAGMPCAAHEVAYSVADRRPQLFVADVCARRNIPLLAYGVMAGGLLSDRLRGVPASKVSLDTPSRQHHGGWFQQAGGWQWVQDMLEALHTVGERHGVTGSAVALRWVLQQPGVAAAVVGARNANHVRSLQQAFTFSLGEEDLLDINAAYEGATRHPTTDVFVWERGGAF